MKKANTRGKLPPTKRPKREITKDVLLSVKNYSQTRKLVQMILGVFGRVWHDHGKNVRIGMSVHGEKAIIGEGDDFRDAMNNTFVRAIEGKQRQEKELAELQAKELAEAEEKAKASAASSEVVSVDAFPTEQDTAADADSTHNPDVSSSSP